MRVRVRAGVQVEREREFLSFTYRGSGVGFIEFIKIKIQSHHDLQYLCRMVSYQLHSVIVRQWTVPRTLVHAGLLIPLSK